MMPATSSAPVFSQSRQASFGRRCHDDLELRRLLVEALGDILADHVQRAVAARADLALGLDHHLLVRQMIEALGAALAALAGTLGLQRGIGLLGLRLDLGVLGLQRLQRERELVVVDALGAAAEHGAAHLGDDVFELLVAGRELVALGGDLIALRKQSGVGACVPLRSTRAGRRYHRAALTARSSWRADKLISAASGSSDPSTESSCRRMGWRAHRRSGRQRSQRRRSAPS